MFIRHREKKPIEFDLLKIIDYTAAQDGSSSLAEITVPPGVSHKISWSKRSDKYYYLISGTLRFTLVDETADLYPGDVCLVPKGDRFKYTNIGSDDALLILVHTPSFHLESEVFEDS